MLSRIACQEPRLSSAADELSFTSSFVTVLMGSSVCISLDFIHAFLCRTRFSVPTNTNTASHESRNQASSYLLLKFSLSHRFYFFLLFSLFLPSVFVHGFCVKSILSACVATRETRHLGGARNDTIGSPTKASTPHQHSTASSFIKIFCF